MQLKKRAACGSLFREGVKGLAGARPGSSSRQRQFSRKRVIGLKILAAAALMSAISATSAFADDPDAFQAQYPDRDILNGGALTPAARAGLVQPFGAAGGSTPSGAYAGTDGAGPSLRTQHHGRRHPYR